MRLHQLCLAGIFILFSRFATAGEAPFVKELVGDHVVAANTLVVEDDKLNAAGNALISSYQSINDVVSFEIDFGSQPFFYNQNFTAKLDYTLIRYKNDLPDEIQDSLLLSLSVDFKNDGSGYKGIAYYKFTGSRKYMLRIRSISSAEMDPVKPIFRLKGQIQIDRKYVFDPVSTDIMQYSKVGNQLTVFWQPNLYKGAEEFDLEYTYIDKESAVAISNGWQPNVTYDIAPAIMDGWFLNNASRVVSDGSAHTINMINGEGFLLFRIRHVQYTVDGNVRDEGQWNYKAMALGGSAVGVGLVYMDWHEPDLNWQYTINFAEQGKKKEVVTYFDGSLRNRQMVTLNNTDNVAVVQEAMYDRLGRPALQVLPAPTLDHTFHYFKNFTRNLANNPYSYLDLGDGENCSPVAAAMATASGASRYYSPSNEFAGLRPETRHIADAETYPFTATSYTNDNTGRIKAQGGVGPSFQLNTGKDTKYYYGKPTQTELDRLFGVEAGDASHYLKNMVVDPNGQVSVSYVNASGKTVATALAGNKPNNLEWLDMTNTATTRVINEIIKPSDFSRGKNNSISASSTFMAPITGSYTIDYSVNPMKLATVYGLNKDSIICSTCYYDLDISVKNDCNEVLYTEVIKQVGPFDSACASSAGALTGSRSIPISEIGEYNVTYTLTVSKAAVDSFSNWHLTRNTDIKKLNNFVRDEMLNADFVSCISDCATCNENLGTKLSFVERFKTIFQKQGLAFTVADSMVVNQIYDSLYLTCQQMQVNCGTKRTPCDDKLDILKADVKPGGQYGLLDSLGRLTDLNTNVIAQRSRIVFFTDENGVRDAVTLVDQYGEDSVQIDVTQLNDSLFIKYFKDSWADSLVRLHPEYCFYLWCTGNVNSYVFDSKIEDLLDGDSAVVQGWFNRSNYNAILNADPFFTEGAGVPFRQSMDADLARYSREYFGYSGPDRNILQMVDALLYCSNQTDPYANCSIDNSCRAINREWEMYRRFYINLKQRYYEKARLADPAYAGCVNCFIGADLMSGTSFQNLLTPSSNVSKILHSNNAYTVAAVADKTGGSIYSFTAYLPSGPRQLLTQVDSIGQIVWTKEMEEGVGIRSVNVADDSSIYVYGAKSVLTKPGNLYLEEGATLSSLPFVSRYDKLGTMLWSKLVYPDSLIGNTPYVDTRIITSTGGNIIVSYRVEGKDGFYLNCLDSNGSVVSSVFTQIGYLPEYYDFKNLLVVGDTAFVSLVTDNPTRIYVKINYKTGQVYWVKSPNIEGYYERFPSKFLDYKDGILSSATEYTFFRLDANGNVLSAFQLPYNSGLEISRIGDHEYFAAGDSWEGYTFFKFNDGGSVYDGAILDFSQYGKWPMPNSLMRLSTGDLVYTSKVATSVFGAENDAVLYLQFPDTLYKKACIFKDYNPGTSSPLSLSTWDWQATGRTVTSYSAYDTLSFSPYVVAEYEMCQLSVPVGSDSCKDNGNRRIFRTAFADLASGVAADGSNALVVGEVNTGDRILPSIIKLDASGQVIWNKRMQSNTSGGGFKKVIKVSSGGYLAIGRMNSISHPQGALLLTRFNDAGEVVWSNELNITINGSGSNFGRAIKETAEGDFVIVGESYNGSISHFVAKVGPDGGVWYVNPVNIPYSSEATDLTLDGDTAYVHAQAFGVGSGNWKGHVYKFNHKSRQIYWSKVLSIDGLNSYPLQSYFKQGNLHLAYNSDNYTGDFSAFVTSLLVLDRSGNVLSAKTINNTNPNIVSNVVVLNDGSAILNSFDYTPNTTQNMPLSQSKISPSGVQVWSNRYVTKGQFSPTDVTVNGTGQILSVGRFSDTTGAISDAYFFKTDSNGDIDSCGTTTQVLSIVNSEVTASDLSIIFGEPAVTRYPPVNDSFVNTSTDDSSFCNLDCQRPPDYVFPSYGCPDGQYVPFDKPGVRHQIQSGKASQKPAQLNGFNGWRFYSVFLLKTGTTSSCRFTNVWVASCEKKVVFTCPPTSSFNGLVSTPLCENGTKLGAIVRYNGPAIPANANVTVQATFNSSTTNWTGTFVFLSGQTESYQCSPFLLNSGPVSVSIIGVYCNLAGVDTSCVSDVLPPSYCTNNQLIEYYQQKVKRFPEYVNTAELTNQIQSVDLSVYSANSSSELRATCAENCDAQADYWINTLSGCTNDPVQLENLRAALIAICKEGCADGDFMGSSSVPNNAYSLYRTFEEAIVGILGPQALSFNCTQELLANPYPYGKKPVYTERVISNTDAQICQKLSGLQASYASSGFTGSFYRYLVNTLGRGMTMDSLDVQDMQNACTTCRNVLKNNITLPAAFEPYAQGLNCATANTLLANFRTIYGLDTVHPNYEKVLTNYFNHQLGFALDFEDYQPFLRGCEQPSTAVLYNRGMQVELEEDENACLESVFNMVLTNASILYTAYIDSVRKDFQDAYVSRCLNVTAKLTMTSDLKEYHYTLYYYDQSGNLVKTVPPAGVVLLSQTDIDKIQKNRAAGNLECFDNQDQVRFNNNGYYTFASSSQSAITMRPGLNAFTVEAWYKFRTYTSQGIFSLHVPGTGNAYGQGYIMQVRNDSLIFRVADTATRFIEARLGKLSTLIPDTNWRHVVVQKTNSTPALRIYINGTPMPASVVNVAFTNTRPVSPVATLRIGGSPIPSGSANFNGSIRQFRYYQRALSTVEIRQNYLNSCLLPASMEGLIFWSQLNEGTGVIRNNINLDVASTTGTAPSWYSNRAAIYPAHTLATTYEYNSFNQVKKQFSPDGGTSEFWYDRLGRLVASQNDQQKLETGLFTLGADRYSYTKYDPLGRITEVGEKVNTVNNPRNSNFLNNAMVDAFLNNGPSAQITKTIYDQAIFSYQNPGTARKRVSATLYQDTQVESDPDATYYSYDIMGNVKTLVQHSKELVAADNSNGEKRIDYEYDLISGKVNRVIYQPGKGDQFIHRYDYDADNRIISVNTSRDGLVWQNDAKYVYHLHGPLARTELGDLKVQGIDYAYTLQGWLKGVNSSSLGDPQFDIGQDGKTGGSMPIVARDAFGYMLDYYRGDYKPIGQQQYSINSFKGPASVAASGFRDLFNGNIGGMLTNIKQLNEPMYYRYTYDQLNRIKSMDAYRGQNAENNTWSAPVQTQDYQERISYDPNGNIKTYLRNGRTTTAMDNLTYNYTPNTNKLRQVLDAVPDGNYTEDIDGQPLADNYTYDRIGNMKTDNAGGIASITWTVYGKIKRITKLNNDFIEYRYDASGNRTSKLVSAGSTTITYYVRDAQGNVMAVYEKQAANPLKWAEQHLYGSSRLGLWTFGETIPGATTKPTGNSSLEDGYIYGKKFFELGNHLNNVLATVTDKKIGVDDGGDGITDYFMPEIISTQDYYPFGMQMPGRKYTMPSSGYRYGFNGKENDNEVRGEGNQQDFGMRIYDPRLGKFLSLDPLARNYPDGSNYRFAMNSPIYKIDIDGEWDITVHAYSDRKKYGYGIAIVTDRNGNEVYRFKVRLEGVGGRDRMVKDSDTPLGVYDIPDGNDKWIRGKSRQSYGRFPRLALNGVSGEILKSGRSEIRIHGGRQETPIKDKNGKIIGWQPISNPQLKKTHGCLRAFDEDVNQLKEVVDKLEENDVKEKGGSLTIVDDLQMDINGGVFIPATLTPVNPDPIPPTTVQTIQRELVHPQPGLIQRLKNWWNSLPMHKIREFDPKEQKYGEPSYGPKN